MGVKKNPKFKLKFEEKYEKSLWEIKNEQK